MGASPDVIVIGGGVAGLSVAAALAPHARVLLLESEPALAQHASGDNAAIFRPLEHDTTSAWLARRSLEWLSQLGEGSVLARTGLLLASRDHARASEVREQARAQGVAHSWLDRAELVQVDPWLAGGEAEHGVLLQEGGVLDIPALTSRLANAARAHRAELRCGARVARIEVSDGSSPRVTGVTLHDGARLAAQHVVIAAGAWTSALGGTARAILPLTPTRRHLALLRLDAPPPSAAGAQRPVVWRLEDEVYYRAHPTGLLASPCDATPWRAEVPPSDPALIDSLGAKLSRLAPRLPSTRIERAWACLRTFSVDAELIAGPDPRVGGLHWLAGLGGRGMSVAPAAGELVARRIAGDHGHPLAQALGPTRPTLSSFGA
jgi:D-arginine dehydrogenase